MTSSLRFEKMELGNTDSKEIGGDVLMFKLPDIRVKYRADRRIKVVEVSYKSKKFLVELELFVDETGIRDFEESTSGEAFIDPIIYARLEGNKL